MDIELETWSDGLKVYGLILDLARQHGYSLVSDHDQDDVVGPQCMAARLTKQRQEAEPLQLDVIYDWTDGYLIILDDSPVSEATIEY